MEIDADRLELMKQAVSELVSLVHNLDLEPINCPSKFPGFINGYRGYGCGKGNHIGRHSIRFTQGSATILLEWDT